MDKNQGLKFYYGEYSGKDGRSIMEYKGFSIKVYDDKIIAENKNYFFGFKSDGLSISKLDSDKKKEDKINYLKEILIKHIDRLNRFSFLKVKSEMFNFIKNKIEQNGYIFKDNKFTKDEMKFYMQVIELKNEDKNYYIIEPVRANDGSNKEMFWPESNIIFENLKLKIW